LQKLAPAKSAMNGIRGQIIRQLLNSWQKNMLAGLVFANVDIDENHLTATYLVFKVFQQR